MCVRCLKKPAKIWGGYVKRGDKELFAGWCSDRCANARGFSGHWREDMGFTSSLRKVSP